MALQTVFLLLLVVLAIGTVQGWDGNIAYDFSHEFEGSRYFISRYPEPFDLAKMNRRCKAYGGYLVQIDSFIEFRYLKFEANRRADPSLVYTGITDLGSEGRFYNYNDKKPAAYLTWKRGQPDNWAGKEHCVHITRWGFNDIGCDGNGRYMCEVKV
ncbi:hypothetical protein PoB_002443500 [Plakobranchus ocellatus]|uniref:C-type lectin domain-containing protein n=1 Tax=Plakobranchus ocellatus TaxID=259542 RepID=A0AAV3ZTI1_9GAST|nr:hypothetical protein PoB_002443500 [Plakobranchus ocellatus]